MKIIKTQSKETQVVMSRNDWQQIGVVSGWFEKHAVDIDLTKQKADTDKLYKVLSQMRGELGVLQNNNNPQKAEAIKLRLNDILDDISDNNFVVKLDAEIGLDVENLKTAINAYNLEEFNKILESYFKPNLDESKAQLDRLLQKQKGGAQGVAVGLEQVVEDTGDSNA